jgi:hypothetical protein
MLYIQFNPIAFIYDFCSISNEPFNPFYRAYNGCDYPNNRGPHWQSHNFLRNPMIRILLISTSTGESATK